MKVAKNSFHFILIIIFFLTHGYKENFGLISFINMLIFFALATLAGLTLFFIFQKIFQYSIKTGIWISCLAIIFLFFGAFMDFIQSISFLQPIIKYRFLLPLLLGILILLFVFLQRTKKSLFVINRYITVLFLIFILIDIISIIVFSVTPAKRNSRLVNIDFNYPMPACDDCARPDIYLILLDDYTGSDGLKRNLHYDNSDFENFLTTSGFHVVAGARSNYTTTILSIASLLNMSYLSGFTKPELIAQDYSRILPIISTNKATSYLTSQGYDFINYSIFDINNQQPAFSRNFFPSEFELIFDKTLIKRLSKDLVLDLNIAGLKIKWGIEMEDEKVVQTNMQIIKNTIAESNKKNTRSKFVYTHLIMPHPPYWNDSTGKVIRKSYNVPFAEHNSYYLNYLVYTNKIVKDMIRSLHANTNNNAVIILLSDHGHSGFYPPVKKEDFYTTLNAVFLPGMNYDGFYEGMSNVNEFRILFNKLFNHHLPMAKDSLLSIRD